MTIHHATQTRAAKLGVTLTEADDGSVTFETDGVLSPSFPSGKEALEAAIEYASDDQPNIHDVEEDDDDEDEPVAASIVKASYRAEYKARGDASTCGDDLAYAIRGFVTVEDAKGKSVLSLSDLQTLADDNDLGEKVTERWSHLNPGQKRMNLGNMLRSRYKKGEAVIIGNETWQLTQDEMEEAAGL